MAQVAICERDNECTSGTLPRLHVEVLFCSLNHPLCSGMLLYKQKQDDLTIRVELWIVFCGWWLTSSFLGSVRSQWPIVFAAD